MAAVTSPRRKSTLSAYSPRRNSIAAHSQFFAFKTGGKTRKALRACGGSAVGIKQIPPPFVHVVSDGDKLFALAGAAGVRNAQGKVLFAPLRFLPPRQFPFFAFSHENLHGVHVGEIVQKVFSVAHVGQGAILHDGYPVGKGKRLAGVVGDVYEGGLGQLPAKFRKQAAELRPLKGRDVAHRLVHKYQRGLFYHGFCQRRPLLLTARKGAGALTCGVGKSQLLQHGHYHRLLLPLVHAAQRQSDVFVHRHVGIKHVFLKHQRHVPFPLRKIFRQHAVDVQLPRGGGNDACNGFEQGGLTAAGGAHNHQKLAAFYLQRAVFKGVFIFVYLGKILYVYRRHCSSSDGFSKSVSTSSAAACILSVARSACSACWGRATGSSLPYLSPLP